MMAKTSGQRSPNATGVAGEAAPPDRLVVSRRWLLIAAGWAGALVLTVPSLRRARAQSGPAAFLQDLGDRAVAMLSDPALPATTRTEKFRSLMRESFDLPAIGRFILGRYWQRASEAQQEAFLETFQQVMSARFAPYFAESSKDSFSILGAAGGVGDRQVVRSRIRLEGGQLADVDWHLVERDGHFKIVDVVTEGVSMGITLRSEYGSVLSTHGGDIEALIKLLRQKVAA